MRICRKPNTVGGASTVAQSVKMAHIAFECSDPFTQQRCEEFVFGLGRNLPPGIKQVPRLPETLKDARQVAFRNGQARISRLRKHTHFLSVNA